MMDCYLFAFFELGGGFVFSIACNTSSNLAGARVSRSVLRVEIFFFGFVFRPDSFPAPSWQSLMFPHKIGKLATQSAALDTLFVGDSAFPGPHGSFGVQRPGSPIRASGQAAKALSSQLFSFPLSRVARTD